MRNYREHLIRRGSQIKEALAMLDKLASDAILFVINASDVLVGSLTDGDVRRGLLKGLDTSDIVDEFIQPNPKFIMRGKYSVADIIRFRENDFKVIPIVDKDHVVLNVLNLKLQKSYLPVDAVVMAGGFGTRLKPLTDTVPKPLLEVGGKAILEHNLDRLHKFGIDDLWISIRYLGEQIQDKFSDGASRNQRIQYVTEDAPLGTIGAVSKIENWQHDYVLVTNSDILTTLDYEDFFLNFTENEADMSVVTIPYKVDVPYAVMETENNVVTSFKEKPTYTYYSNGGIYLIKKSILNKIPRNSFYNSTDLMEAVINEGGKLISYPIRQYWLDIGKHADFEKAQADIKHLDL